MEKLCNPHAAAATNLCPHLPMQWPTPQTQPAKCYLQRPVNTWSQKAKRSLPVLGHTTDTRVAGVLGGTIAPDCWCGNSWLTTSEVSTRCVHPFGNGHPAPRLASGR